MRILLYKLNFCIIPKDQIFIVAKVGAVVATVVPAVVPDASEFALLLQPQSAAISAAAVQTAKTTNNLFISYTSFLKQKTFSNLRRTLVFFLPSAPGYLKKYTVLKVCLLIQIKAQKYPFITIIHLIVQQMSSKNTVYLFFCNFQHETIDF